MPSTLEIDTLTPAQRPGGAWVAGLIQALARDEAAGRRPRRLTEPRLATWTRFRGRLTATDLVALLFEDAAVIHPIPFDAARVGVPTGWDRLPETVAQGWIDGLAGLDLAGDPADYIAGQARLLGLPTRLARSELHVVKPHQRVLELPGTGGQLAHHLVATQGDLSLKDNFTVACASWQELTMAGIVALDLGAADTGFATRVEVADLRDPTHPLRQRGYDFVIGLHPDKGGPFQVQDQLAIWFANAKPLLV